MRYGPSKMIVSDAGIVANALASGTGAGRTARAALAAAGPVALPYLADSEVASVLRTMWRRGHLSETGLGDALVLLARLPYPRHQPPDFHERAFELRHNVTPYDAMYVALAEALGCELLALDARLARAPGLRCSVRVLTGDS